MWSAILLNTNFIRWNYVVSRYWPKTEKNLSIELTQKVLKNLSPYGRIGAIRYWQKVMHQLSQDRYEHVLRVLTLADKISQANNFSPSQQHATAQAAILHDIARELLQKEMFKLASPQLETERICYLTLHGKAGRKLAQNWGVKDKSVLNAIEGHLFGVPSKDTVGMAVYVADVSEPGRGVNQDIRELALRSLERAYQRAVISKVNYLQSRGKTIHPDTLKVYDEVCNTA